jgi:hypothetical protein
VTTRVLLVLALGGCATSSGMSDVHPLARTQYTHRLQPGWHLRSIALTPAPGEGKCRARDNALRVELVYDREGGSRSTPVTSVQCVFEHSFLPLAVQQTADGQFQVGQLVEVVEPRKAPPATPSNQGGLVPARLVKQVPAVIPRVLQMSEKGKRYHAAVCTDEKGNVISLRLVGDHHHPEIDARVLDALMDWKYEPARLNGNPVPSCPWAVMVL